MSHSQRRRKSGEVFEKNAGEWTGRVEISKEKIPDSKRSIYGFMTLCQSSFSFHLNNSDTYKIITNRQILNIFDRLFVDILKS